MRRRLLLAAVSASSFFVGEASKTCGSITCPPFYYCQDSDFHNICASCKEACEGKRADNKACNESCQDYLQKMDFQSKIATLQTLAVIAIILACLALCIAMLSFFGRTRLRRFISGIRSPTKKTNANNNNQVENGSVGGLRLGIAQPQQPSPTGTTPGTPYTISTTVPSTHFGGGHINGTSQNNVSTPISRQRHPSEDATLEYAYENRGLSQSSITVDQVGVSPSNRKESSF